MGLEFGLEFGKFMKKLHILLFSMLMSFNSYGEWTWEGESASNSSNWYIDLYKTRKVDNYIYYWTMSVLLKPDIDGDLSYVNYLQGDCKLMRTMNLSEFYYTQPMAVGNATTNTIENPSWIFPVPNSGTELMLKSACNYANLMP